MAVSRLDRLPVLVVLGRTSQGQLRKPEEKADAVIPRQPARDLDMEFRTGLYLMSLLNVARCSAESPYTVHLNKLSFQDAQKFCSPGSFLTDVRTDEEKLKILKAIWEKNNKTTATFWIGLKKEKGHCGRRAPPLKGFSWTVDNTTQSDVHLWKTEPSYTCTDARCGLISVEYGESAPINTGFLDATCKHEHAFICKRNMKLPCPRPNIHGTHDIIDLPSDPFTRQVLCGSGARFTLTCSNDLVWTVADNENKDVFQLCLECEKGYRRDPSGNCVDVNECDESNPCAFRCLNTEGSYKCTCSNESDDTCDGSKPPTADMKSDEYSNINRGKSVPTSVPSDDVRANETVVHVEESAGDVSNIVVPAIIALLIFIVLLVIVAAIVKGCLRRRTVKLAQRKAEAVALNGSSSMEKVNEKEET